MCIHTNITHTHLCYKYQCLRSVAQAECQPHKHKRAHPPHICHAYSPLEPTCPSPAWPWLSPAGHTVSMCMPANTASYIDPSSAFMTMKGGRKEKEFYLQLRLCSGFNRGRQGQQAGRGGAEGNCLGQRQRAGGQGEPAAAGGAAGEVGGGTQYLDKPYKVGEGDAEIGLARTFSSHKFSLAAWSLEPGAWRPEARNLSKS